MQPNWFQDLHLARAGMVPQNCPEQMQNFKVWRLQSELPYGQSQAAAGLCLQTVFCLWGALYSQGVLGFGLELPATSSHMLEVTMLLNSYHVSMSFRLSRTRRPSMIISFPLPLSQLKSLLRLSDSLIIENCGHESWRDANEGCHLLISVCTPWAQRWVESWCWVCLLCFPCTWEQSHRESDSEAWNGCSFLHPQNEFISSSRTSFPTLTAGQRGDGIQPARV